MNLIMKMLAAPATVLALWAVSAQAATNDDIAKRLEPVGQVCVQGQECKGMEVAASAGGGGGAKTPDEVIAKHCNACHGSGLLGAPKIGDTAACRSSDFHPLALFALDTDLADWLKALGDFVIGRSLSAGSPEGQYGCWYGQHFHN